jgi:hypothetical protein
MSKKVKLSALLAGVAIAPWLLTVTVFPSAAGEEVFGVTSIINVPSLGTNMLGLRSFDISFVDPASGFYLLADRSNKSVVLVETSTNTLTHQLTAPAPGFAGAVLCPPPSNAANDCAGPDGVLVANGHQIWVGDGNSQVWVLDLTSSPPGNLIAGPISTALNGAGTDPTRADELCHDPNNNIILIANDASSPSPFVTFISSTSFNVLGHIVMDGTKGTPTAAGGIEQCQWSPRTGKFYLNVPNPAEHPDDGVVLQIDPVSETIEKTFPLTGSGCNGNAGMALGPFPQALLGCSNAGPNSVIINLNSGSVIGTLADESGADEVWFNPANNQYFLANGNHLSPSGNPDPTLGVVDTTGKKNDFSPKSAVGSHSVAADPVKNQVYVPINSGTGAASKICSSVTGGNGVDANGCIAVFTDTSGTDATCLAQGAPVTGMNDGEPDFLKANCPPSQ